MAGFCGIGGAAVGGAVAPEITFLLSAQLFNLTATFDKSLVAPARFDKAGAAAAVFDKTRAIAISVITEE